MIVLFWILHNTITTAQHTTITPCISDSLLSIEQKYSTDIKRESIRKELLGIAQCFYNNGQYDSALVRLGFIEEKLIPESNFTDEEAVKFYKLYGKAYKYSYQTKKSIVYFKKALSRLTVTQKKEHVIEKADLLRRVADGYLELEDYLATLDYARYALAEIRNNNLKSTALEIRILNTSADAYRFLNNYKEAKQQYGLAIELANKINSNKKKFLGELYSRLGILHYHYDKYEEGIVCLKKSIQFYTEFGGKDNPSTVHAINSLGNIYYYLEDYSEASKLFLSTIGSFKKKGVIEILASQYSKIAACYTNMGEYDKADKYLQDAFSLVDFDSRRAHPFASYKGKPGDFLIILYFAAKNHQKAFEAGRGRRELYRAAHYFSLCIQYLEHISDGLDESGSQTYFLDRFYYVIEASINNCYHLHQETDSLQYLGLAFGYAERSKALLLKEALQKANVEAQLGMPQALLGREYSLKREISLLENQRYEARLAGNEKLGYELTSQLYDLKKACNALQDSINAAYPAYEQFRRPVAPMAIEDVRARLLEPGQALVQYFDGEDGLYLFVITAKGCTLTMLKRDSALTKAVEGFRESIYGWALEQQDSLLTQYRHYGRYLYQQLIEPVAALLPSHLIIIPDGVLAYLPFEALLCEAPPDNPLAFNTYPYLLNRYRVTYAHSARLLDEMRQGRNLAPRQRVLAFAPYFEESPGGDNSVAQRRNGLSRLFSNEREVAAIHHLLKTRIRQRGEATRARFLDEAPFYSILHLATHAKANDEEGEYSYLAFTGAADTLNDARLYAKDLFTMRLPAEMVVLSACETGLGELRRGEGVISLARGFTQAGARSLITTLWRVSDQESADLMRLFYEGLAQGLHKDEALRHAKQAYLSTAPSTRAHPFFWAAFVSSGDMSPIGVSRQPSGFWRWGLALATLGMLGWWLRKRRGEAMAYKR